MSGQLSKRQQARNERALQDLIKTVPGNNVCADCQARNPGWASWSLGIFLCMRCAALHRKLGTHITKVKSLSMDSWSNEQVENMKRVGNIASNKIYNPQNTRPPIPFDVDEADSAMERFIRQKYQDRTAAAPMRQHSGSTGSDEPPPLPPKTGSRFGFRSASSIFPLSSKSKREAARVDFEQSRERSPSPRRNKPSRVFSATIAAEAHDDMDSKMAKLRDMGFKDEKRNIAVLKGLSGNLEKSIETLVRLGEGNGSQVFTKTGDAPAPSRSRTPISPTAGITIDHTRAKSPPRASTNPFDMLDAPPPPAKPQSTQSTGSIVQPHSPMMGNNPYQQFSNSNPFGLMPSQSQVNLNHAFSNMAISSSQPLFPNHTGGFPGPQPSQQQQIYQQSMTPPVPSIPQQYYPLVIYENPAQQPQQNASYNPFLQQQPQQVPQPPPINTNFQSNPYLQQSLGGSTMMYQSPVAQSPQVENSPQQYRSASAFHSFQNQQQTQSNPFFQNNQQPQAPQQEYDYRAQQQQQYQQFGQQTHPLLPQQTLRADKRSILDLYNYPQLAPSPVQQQQQPQQDQSQVQNMSSMPQQMAPQQQQQRSVSSPLATHMAGSRNPFMSSGGGVQSTGSNGNMGQFSPAQQNGARHVSQESVSIDPGWQSGRHSPDAWGTISARSMR
ncbi:hypothetical protein G7Y89_g8181 [Cudoniella acicularis]|uniref:UBA domain-containing protein 3 n=1 Tax=Cudoniella acicularis TaxID=354080 RepID=A0A8H4RH37_9HELO|nr:hypothetical protein G7Y89_g8181 [Cudoniella acicularis]